MPTPKPQHHPQRLESLRSTNIDCLRCEQPKPLAGSKIHKFYSKRELSQWVDSLPDDKDGGAA